MSFDRPWRAVLGNLAGMNGVVGGSEGWRRSTAVEAGAVFKLSEAGAGAGKQATGANDTEQPKSMDQPVDLPSSAAWA